MRCELARRGPERHPGRGVGRRGGPHRAAGRRRRRAAVAHRSGAQLETAFTRASERGSAGV